MLLEQCPRYLDGYVIVPIMTIGPATKSDDFLEKFQTAFEPPLIFGKLCCNFFLMDMEEGMRAREYEMHAHDFQIGTILIF